MIACTLRVPVTSVGPNDPFASLGMDSLAAVELAADIEEALGVDLPGTAVHEYSSLAALSRFIESGADEMLGRARHEQMLSDAALPPDVAPTAGKPSVRARDARTILLTGATGFLGAFLLRDLLAATSATVLCLVRPRDRSSRGHREQGDESAFAAIRQNLERYGVWRADYADRIRILPGDLAEPRLGLTDEMFAALSNDIDVIYHAAADVNWVHGYETLRATNVLGTRELLRLACLYTPKPFHFLSSVSVCHSTTGPRLVDETTETFAGLDGLRFGYAQSKCVAEALVRDAGVRGLPVSIVRPSFITGDGVRGRSNVDDLTTRFIAGCIRMHAAPDLDWRMDCVPVDDVSRAVLRLTIDHDAGTRLAHVTAEQPRHWRELVLWMRLCGYDLDLVPYREWMDILRSTDDPGHSLHPLRSFFLHAIAAENHLTLPELFEESRRPRVANTRTARTLGDAGIQMTPLDSPLLGRYFDDFVARGVVPDAPRRPPRSPGVGAHGSPLAGCEPALARALGAQVGDDSLGVSDIRLTRLASDESIVAELTAWRAGTRAGLYVGDAAIRGARTAERRVRIFVKAKASDEQVIEVAEAVAALASPALGDTVSRFREHLGVTRGHVRELALYACPDERLRAHTPRPLVVERSDERRRWVLALESIDDAVVFNAIETRYWSEPAIDAALLGLSSIHAVWYRRDDALVGEPWLAPVRDTRRRVEMTPHWTALAEHAWRHSPAWREERLHRVHERMIVEVDAWSRRLDRGPRTLIHNDFNPRNIALRRAPEGLRLSAFDWELATIGAPQRDLAELLCFVLPPDASLTTIARWVERYRALLAAATMSVLERDEWEVGFAAALADLLVDRLSTYAMIDRVRPQPFLPRVVRSWLNIFRHYPWAG